MRKMAFSLLLLFLAASPSFAEPNKPTEKCRDSFATLAELISEPLRLGQVGGRIHLEGIYNPKPQSWGNLRTSQEKLRSFDPTKFRLLVHAGSTPSKIDRLLSDPKSLENAFTFSASVIDETHRATYGRYGVILSAPPENILATSPKDMGTPFAKVFTDSHDLVRDPFYPMLIESNPTQTVDHLLKRTASEHHNEVMVAGTTTNGGAVQIVGVFVKTKGSQEAVEPELYQKLKRFAKLLKIPIVRIEAPPENEF